MEESKRKVAGRFDLASPTYDDAPLRFMDHHAQALVGAAEIVPGMRVLDVATGTGKVALLAAEGVGARGRVTGIDISPGMLAQARRKAKDLPVEFLEMDAETLRFSDESFDTVLCGFGVFFLPDLLGGMREMWRVLRPGGRVALTTWRPGAFDPMGEWTLARLERHGIPRPGAPPEPWMLLEQPEHLERLLERAGLRERRVVTEPYGYNMTPEERLRITLTTAADRLRLLTPEEEQRFRDDYLAEATRTGTPKGHWLEVSALIGTGVR